MVLLIATAIFTSACHNNTLKFQKNNTNDSLNLLIYWDGLDI